MLAGAGLLCGCYYDPYTGVTSAYPPPYGYPPPAPGYGEAPAAGYGGPPGYGEAAPQGYGGAAPQAYAAPPPAYSGVPPAYGPAPQAYGGAPAAAGWITRDQFVQRATQHAAAANRDPQRAAQRAGAVFDQIDVNHTGVITQAQLRAWRQAHARPAGGGAPQPEYQ
jgi:hypothetical protein